MSIEDFNLMIGCRIQDYDGFKATVKYIGPVAASKIKDEIWLGVLWDDSSRGKHDGSCVENGIVYRYFECPMGCGSFIKKSKIKKPKTLQEAIAERYVSLDAPEMITSDSKLPDAFVSTSKGNQLQIELVGEMKLRKWQQINTLDKITIRNDCIASIGNEISNIASHLVEIDLQDNLLWQYSEIFYLGNQIPSLTSLLLHGNKLLDFTQSIADEILYPEGLSKLKRLALNATGISSWSSVQLLEQYLPAIEELYLTDNDLWDMPYIDVESMNNDVNGAVSTSKSFISGFKSLRILDISSCKIDEWGKIRSLGKLPVLQQLLLDDNPITIIPPNTKDCFVQLSRVSLSSTKIASWSDIDNLSSCVNLTHIRLSSIPLFRGLGASEARALMIGRLSGLNVFNGSSISPRERRDAEKTYLRSIIRQLQKSSIGSSLSQIHGSSSSSYEIKESIMKQHPRYEELKILYEEDIQILMREEASTGTRTIAAELINIKLVYIGMNQVTNSSNQNNVHEKKLPLSLTISKLKLMLKQIFGFDPELQQLTAKVDKESIPIVLDEDEASLSYYGIINDSIIYLSDKD